ncbi:DNA-directed RNA polymerase subunit alpha [bacterium DOLZORAL124_38_8]|nr:MAG: DNA-directed RNA polymerase subunit alpha [bacterium DOLZORAL124_38_8]
MHILHQVIGTPQIKIQAGADKGKATMVVSPLPQGYGVTIGNSLRRVLLSSLPGAAVSSMKIDGVTHEYMAIDGVKETVFDITLNLRALRLKKHSKDIETVEVPFVKSGKVFAKDLKVSSDIEVLNPEQLIMTCDGANVKRKMVIEVEKGVGYRLVENTDSAAVEDVEKILIDANFSPVSKVQYEVTPARVGDITNLDQLSLKVETDGSLEAEQALKLSAGILTSYFELFNKEDAYTDTDFTTSFEKLKQERENKEKADAEAVETTFTPIDILGLSQRTLNALVNGGITSVEELLSTPMTQLTQLRGFGQKAKTELEQILTERGYMPKIDSSKINANIAKD